MGRNRFPDKECVVKYIWLIGIAQLLDLLLTLVAIVYFNCWESNPIMRDVSLIEMTVIKIAGASLVLLTLCHKSRIPLWTFKLLFWASFAVIPWNILVITLEALG